MVKQFIAGFITCLLLVSCAGAGFSYRYYGLSEAVYDNGVLLGPTEKDDIPFSRCSPRDAIKHPCVVMLTSDFYAFKQDYEDSETKLIDCQRGR
jgi:hypothetical protein